MFYHKKYIFHFRNYRIYFNALFFNCVYIIIPKNTCNPTSRFLFFPNSFTPRIVFFNINV